MTISKGETNLSELERAIALYQTALETIESAKLGPSKAQAMEVIAARDAVQAALNEEPLDGVEPGIASRPSLSEPDLRFSPHPATGY